MRVNKLFTAASALGLALAASACDDGLSDINRNPNNPEDVPVSSILASGMWDVVANAGGRGTHGEWVTLYHTELWAQHVAQSSYNDEDRYTPREGINETVWAEMYSGALTDLDRVMDIATEQGDNNLHAVADITSVYGFLFLTDMFGDIPYTQALNLEEFPSPEFTPQEEIYPDLLARLEAAVGKIDPGASVSFAEGDILYGGDLASWIEFGNALRMRVAMRLAGTSLDAQGQAAFQAAWNGEKFDDVEDTADLDWSGTLPAQNPIYEQIVLGGRTADFRASATLVDMLKAFDDPRLEIYVDPALSDGEFRGLPNGKLPSQAGGTLDDFSWIGAAFIEANAPSVLLSYSEMLFLGAEAAERGWIAADAGQLYRDGIAASMQQYGIPGSEITAYLAQPEVQFDGLESIGVQKWLALYLAGTEGFTEFRRTGFPELELAANAYTSAFPARFPYPANEGLYNPNFEPYADVEFTDPVWFMQ